MNSSNQPLSDCHQAPVVLCEGNAWDVPLESIKNGSTYGYGCTECHKWCGIYAAAHPSNQPEPKKPICLDAWAIPPSRGMLKNGKDYYTCSKCGEPCDVVDLKPDAQAELLAFVTDPKTTAKAVEGSMDKRLAVQGELGLREKIDELRKSFLPNNVELDKIMALVEADKSTAVARANLLGKISILEHYDNIGLDEVASRLADMRQALARLQPPTAGEGESV
jgi:hypothetical protein